MKRIIIAACLLIGFAYETKAQAPATSGTPAGNPGGFYIKGGLNLANISISDNGSVNNANTLATFNVGFIADLPASSFFSLQTGLVLNGQGSKTTTYASNTNTSDNFVTSTFNPLYIQLPVNLVFKLPLDNDTRLFVGAGPYVQMGVGGTAKTVSQFGGVQSSNSYDIQFDDDNPTTSQEEGASQDRLKRFDIGMNALAGIESGSIMVGVNYGIGFTKINSTETNSNANDDNKYRTFSLNVGYRF